MKISALVVLLTSLIWISCEEELPPLLPEPDFGDSYSLDISHGIKGIYLRGDSTLFVYVSYGGGCAKHQFQMQYQFQDEIPYLWFNHQANGDPCKAIISETIEQPMPANFMGREEMFIFVPDIEEPKKIK